MNKLTLDTLFDAAALKSALDEKKRLAVAELKSNIAGSILESAGFIYPEDVVEGETLDLQCESCEIETEETEDELKEARIVYRVTAQGKRIKRIKCPPGHRVATINGIKRCVVVSGTQKAKRRLAIIKAQRTRKAKGNAYAQKSIRRRLRALKKRKAMGLGTTTHN